MWSRRRSTPAAAARASSRSSAPTPRAASGWRRSLEEVARQRRGDARQHAGHDPDRRRGQAGQPALRHRRRRHRQGISTSRCWSTAAAGRIAMVVSTEGGMDIEEVAHDTPEKITTITIDPAPGLHAAPRPRGRLRAQARRATSTSRRRSSRSQLYDAFVGARLRDARDQPAGRRPTTASCWCSTPR